VPVGLAQGRIGGPVAAGLAQQLVMVAHDELAAGLGGGAPLAQGAGATQRAEGGPWGAQIRSCSSLVLMEEPTEHVTSAHPASPALGRDTQTDR